MGASRATQTTPNCRAMREGDLWRYEWVRVDEEWVHVVVPGPFADSVAALLTPIPAPNCRCSSPSKITPSRSRGRTRTRRPENGIPEPWLEELLREEIGGGSGAEEAEPVARADLVQGPLLERNHERLTRHLWLQRGLALAQGIPDPWRQGVECSCHKEIRKKKSNCHPKATTSSLHKNKKPKNKSTRPDRKSLQNNRIECRRASFDRMKQHLSELEADLLRKQADLERRTSNKSKNKSTEAGRQSKKSKASKQPKTELAVVEPCEEIAEDAVCVKQESKSAAKIEEVQIIRERPATPSQIPRMIKRSGDHCGSGAGHTEIKPGVAKSKPKSRNQSNCGQTTSSKIQQQQQSRRKSGPIPGYKCGSRCNGGRWSGCPCGSGPSSPTPRRLLGQIDSRIKITRDALDSDRSDRPVDNSRLRAGAFAESTTLKEPETELLFQRSFSKTGASKRAKKLEVQEADQLSRLRGGGEEKREVEVENLLIESLSSGR